MKLENSNCDGEKKNKKNSSCNETQTERVTKLKKTQIVTKLKLRQNSNCERKTQNVEKKIKNSNYNKIKTKSQITAATTTAPF